MTCHCIFNKSNTPGATTVEQELHTLPEQPTSSLFFPHFAQSFVFCVCFVDHYLSIFYIVLSVLQIIFFGSNLKEIILQSVASVITSQFGY